MGPRSGRKKILNDGLRFVKGGRRAREGVHGPIIGTALSAPHFLRGLDNEAELGELLIAGEVVTLQRGGEPALGGEAELLYVYEAARLFDAALELVLVF